MRHIILALLLLAVPLAACENIQRDPNQPVLNGYTVKVADQEVTPPAECVKVMDYYVLQWTSYGHRPWDVLKCVDKEGRRSVFYKSFTKSEWNKRYLPGALKLGAAN